MAEIIAGNLSAPTSIRVKASREAATALPKAEVTDFIAIVFAFIFICHFLPKNRMSSPQTT
jgi:hypothetical protein